MLLAGLRPNRLIAYDDDFIRLTLPSTPKGTAKVQPHLGVKLHGLYDWARGEAFRDALVEKTQVPVRYDPYHRGHAWALVKGRWLECISDHYARFQGRSEREIQLATVEVRQRHRRHGHHFVGTAAKLADFLISLEAEDVLLEHRRRDEEARQVFALMGAAVPGLPIPLDPTREVKQQYPASDIPAASASQAEASHLQEDPDAIYEHY